MIPAGNPFLIVVSLLVFLSIIMFFFLRFRERTGLLYGAIVAAMGVCLYLILSQKEEPQAPMVVPRSSLDSEVQR